MPQADGRIVIDTTMNTDGMKAGARDIGAACKRAAQIAEQMGGKAQVSIERAANAVSRQNAAYAKQVAKVDELRKKKEQMERTKVKSEEYESVCKQVNDLNVKLTKAIEKQRDFLNGGGKTSSKTFDNMENEINQIREDYSAAVRDKGRIESYGNAYVPQDTTAVTAQLTQEEAKLNRMNAELNTSFSSLGQKIADYTGKAAQASSGTNRFGHTMKSMSRSIGKGVLKGLSGVGKKLKSMVSNLVNGRKSAGKMNGAFRGGIGTLLKYGIGIRSLTFLFNKLRGALKDGIDNLVKHDSALNSSLSSIKSSLTQLKNSIASAFSPIITTVVPILNKMIGKLTDAANAVGMFLAALTGQTTYKKATAAQEDYAASLEGTASAAKDAQQNLSGLDEINTWNDAKSGGGGSSGGGFEDVEIGNEISNIAELIKQGGWEELGKAIVDKLNDGIMSINAKEVGGKIATVINKGASLASTLFDRANFDLIGDKVGATIVSAVERIDWSQLGHLSVSGVNMMIDFVSGLTTRMAAIGSDGKTGWDKLGDAVSDFINSALTSIKLTKLAKSASNLIKGLNKTISGALKKLDWDGFARSIASAIGEIDFSSIIGGATKVLSNLTTGVNKLIKGLLDNLDWFALGEEVTHAIKQVLLNIDWGQLLLDAVVIPIKSTIGITEAIFGAIEGIFTSSEDASEELSPELLDLQNEIDGIIQKNDLLRERINNFDASIPESKLADLELARDLVNDIFTLDEIENKTPAQLQEMISKIETLNGLGLEGVSAQFNELTQKVEGSRDAIYQNIDALLKQYEIEAYEEVLKELYKDRIEATNNLAEAQEKLRKAKSDYSEDKAYRDSLEEEANLLKVQIDALDDGRFLTHEESLKLSNLSAEYNGIISDLNDANKTLSDTTTILEGAKNAVDVTSGTLKGLNEQIDITSQGLVNAMADSGTDAGKQFADNIKEEIESANFSSTLRKAMKSKIQISTLYSGNGNVTLNAYASGGLPETGQLFIANEDGPEMVGSIGGHTAVANAIQIVESVAKGVARAVKQTLADGGIGDYLKDVVRKLGDISTSVIHLPSQVSGSPSVGFQTARMPMLATGAVIPPNAPFAAILGDQRHGMNVEAPENLLRKIIREELGREKGGSYQFIAQLNRRTIFSEMIEEAKLRQTSSGKNPFLLGRE